MSQDKFVEIVKEMRKAQRAYYVNFSPLKKGPKEELEKIVDKAIKDFEAEKAKTEKKSPSLF